MENLVALLLTTRKSFVNRAVAQASVQLHELSLFLDHIEEGLAFDGLPSFVLALAVHRSAHEIDIGDTRDFYGVLKRQKQPCAGAFCRVHFQQVCAIKINGPAFDFILLTTGQNRCQRGFTRTVGTHDGVHLTGIDGEAEAFQNGCFFHRSFEFIDFQHYPTLPSSEMDNSFCASTANSMGS